MNHTDSNALFNFMKNNYEESSVMEMEFDDETEYYHGGAFDHEEVKKTTDTAVYTLGKIGSLFSDIYKGIKSGDKDVSIDEIKDLKQQFEKLKAEITEKNKLIEEKDEQIKKLTQEVNDNKTKATNYETKSKDNQSFIDKLLQNNSDEVNKCPEIIKGLKSIK